jgi:hypothetical protein
MPALSSDQALEKLARAVEQARPAELAEFYSELFPDGPLPESVVASKLALQIRGGREVEEIVDLWNVVFPHDHDVWYNEVDQTLHYNEHMAGYAE